MCRAPWAHRKYNVMRHLPCEAEYNHRAVITPAALACQSPCRRAQVAADHPAHSPVAHGAQGCTSQSVDTWRAQIAGVTHTAQSPMERRGVPVNQPLPGERRLQVSHAQTQSPVERRVYQSISRYLKSADCRCHTHRPSRPWSAGVYQSISRYLESADCRCHTHRPSRPWSAGYTSQSVATLRAQIAGVTHTDPVARGAQGIPVNQPLPEERRLQAQNERPASAGVHREKYLSESRPEHKGEARSSTNEDEPDSQIPTKLRPKARATRTQPERPPIGRGARGRPRPRAGLQSTQPAGPRGGGGGQRAAREAKATRARREREKTRAGANASTGEQLQPLPIAKYT